MLKSLAALLNISKDMGSVVTSWGVCFNFQFEYTGPGFSCTGSVEEGEVAM